jgi:hypothetical protein
MDDHRQTSRSGPESGRIGGRTTAAAMGSDESVTIM